MGCRSVAMDDTLQFGAGFLPAVRQAAAHPSFAKLWSRYCFQYSCENFSGMSEDHLPVASAAFVMAKMQRTTQGNGKAGKEAEDRGHLYTHS